MAPHPPQPVPWSPCQRVPRMPDHVPCSPKHLPDTSHLYIVMEEHVRNTIPSPVFNTLLFREV